MGGRPGRADRAGGRCLDRPPADGPDRRAAAGHGRPDRRAPGRPSAAAGRPRRGVARDRLPPPGAERPGERRRAPGRPGRRRGRPRSARTVPTRLHTEELLRALRSRPRRRRRVRDRAPVAPAIRSIWTSPATRPRPPSGSWRPASPRAARCASNTSTWARAEPVSSTSCGAWARPSSCRDTDPTTHTATIVARYGPLQATDVGGPEVAVADRRDSGAGRGRRLRRGHLDLLGRGRAQGQRERPHRQHGRRPAGHRCRRRAPSGWA